METKVEPDAYERELLQVVRRYNARWAALLATDESQPLLEKMADQVRADVEAGRTQPMAFTEDENASPAL